ncbi:hypothetical protein B0H63DRAFT_529140 [Podospora didyma]|uniref:Uncharacterized protein n=1 Tax=Podospora didyma TaxID=330526 RepID=A0AAE0N2X7_9PEZI|nr:hypothetical protein B0H63DRAFT_529140 [Podospora didyma]
MPAAVTPTLNKWRTGKNADGFTLAPILLGNIKRQRDLQPAVQHPQRYRGLYIQSVAGKRVTDLSVRHWDPELQQGWTVGTIEGATSDFSVMIFVDEAEVPATVSAISLFFTTSGAEGGVAGIGEVYPMYEGDEIVEV